MVIFQIFQSQNLIQIYSKRQPNCITLKSSRGGGGMPPNPPSKEHGSAMSSIFSNLKKNNYCFPPPAKSWLRS